METDNNLSKTPEVEVKTSPLPGMENVEEIKLGPDGIPLPPEKSVGVSFAPPEMKGGKHTTIPPLPGLDKDVEKYRKDKALLEEDGADSMAMDALNPTSDTSNKQEWENLLDKYVETEDQFLYRLENGCLTSSDVSIICETLEGSGEEGLSLDVFAAKVRLLEKELVDLALKYPRIEKAIQISRVKRKGFFLQTMVMSAHKSTATMRELFENESVNVDLLQKMEKEKESTKLEDEITNSLRNLGVPPCEYTSVVYLMGDLPEVDDLPDPVEGMKQLKGGQTWLSAEETMNLWKDIFNRDLNKKDNGWEPPTIT